MIGGIAATTEKIAIATGVTCPLIRTHPAIVAHAAATCGAMLPGRFTLGLGTGENLNEHVHGDRRPAPDERVELLEEAIEVIRLLWEGGEQAKQTVFELWRHAGLGGTLNQELPRPSDFDAAAESVTIEMATEHVPCGPDPEPVLAAIREWEQAGFDHIALHQVGSDQEGFLRFWEEELKPKLG